MATVRPKSGFDVDEACKKLQKAMKGAGTNEATIIEVLTSHDAKQRFAIRERYQALCGKDLMKELKSELSGDFESAVLALLTPVPILLSQQLRLAMKGAGTKEAVLVDILLPRTNHELDAIKAAYKLEFGHDLKEELSGELRGELQRLFVAQVSAQRDESTSVDRSRAERDAKELYEAGEGRVGTDEAAFTMILVTRSFVQLKATFEIYEKLAGRDIEESIRKETKGVLRDALLTLASFAKDSIKYYAGRIQSSVKGVGTDEQALIRIIVSRSEVDLELIAKEYAVLFGKPLAKVVSSELSGDFRKLLVKIIGDH
jgi:hypothetical protein